MLLRLVTKSLTPSYKGFLESLLGDNFGWMLAVLWLFKDVAHILTQM